MKLNELNITSALKGLKSKQFSSVDLTKACLDRIKKTNKTLNSFLTLNPKAISEAKKADQLIKSSPKNFEKHPLLGIPYALKDNFLTKGLRTTASAKLLDDYIPQYNSTVYEKLTNSGAILLGKTNMDAWAHGSSTETSDYGPTKNPWNPDFVPGGSSGGSATAVIADQCIFAIGSETAGSVRGPACWCGVTGFKPTYGRVSRYGVVAMASSTDSPGPITKTVTDSAIVTQIIAGHDPHDCTTSTKTVNIHPPKISSLKGLKIALPKEYLVKELDTQTRQHTLKEIHHLENLGATVKEVSLLDPHYSIGVYTIVQRSEVSSNLGRYDGVRYGKDRSYFSKEAKNRIFLGTHTLSTGYYDQYYNHAQKIRTMIINEFKNLFKKFDIVVGPVMPGPAVKIGSSVNNPAFGELMDILMEPSSIAGLTGISVPCGFVNGLPIGLQITGEQFEEQKVLDVAHNYQQSTNWHLQKPSI